MTVRSFQLVPTDPLLRAQGVTLEYAGAHHTVRATHDVSFEVYRSDRFVLLGPSGCGKSTLLKAVGGFIAPRAGSLFLNGLPITRPGPDRIVVFQEFDQLPPWKTVKRNVMFPLLAGGMERREAQARALHWLANWCSAQPRGKAGWASIFFRAEMSFTRTRYSPASPP